MIGIAQATQLTPDKVIDAIEKGLDKGKLWMMPGIAKPAATYYKLMPSVYWKSTLKLANEFEG